MSIARMQHLALAVALAAGAGVSATAAGARAADTSARAAASPVTPEARTADATPGAASPAAAAPLDTLPRVVPIPGVEVSTTRSGARAPAARAVVTRDELLRDNAGQDTPMLLAKLPGAYAYSDAGNGIGYSYLSIRGFPQRRISVLIDGVPLNDPQSHEVYWIDHPDLLASTREVELQRGVGSRAWRWTRARTTPSVWRWR